MLQIKEFEVDKTVEFLALINDVTRGVTASGDPYLNLTFQDATGMINAKLWQATQEQLDTFIKGIPVKVYGEVILYRKKPQLKVRRMELADSIDASHFLPKAPMNEKELKDAIYRYVLHITDIDLSRIVKKVLEKYDEQFFVYPAASKNHHEFVSGLAYHVYTMLRVAESLAAIYPEINKDLLYSGIILHDFGKTIELSGYVSTSYTTPGKLIGHITLAIQEIAKIANELGIEDQESVMLLNHMIISHHGKMEYGSPKEPMIREAELLNLIDNLDARMIMISDSLNDTPVGEFGTRVFALENRSFYHPEIYKK
jgi:3'-5' exoribonuclease